MLSREIQSCHNILGEIMHTAGEEQAVVLRAVRRVLAQASIDAQALEARVIVNNQQEGKGCLKK